MRYPHVQLRGSTYYYRRAIPPDIRPIIGDLMGKSDKNGSCEITESLRTKDREEAKRRCHAKDVEVDRLFAQGRPGVNLTQAEAEVLARCWLDKVLADDAEARVRGEYKNTKSGVVEDTEDLAASALYDAKEALAEGDLSAVERTLELFSADQGLLIPKGSESYRRLAHALLRTSVQYWERINERLVGRWREDESQTFPQLTPAAQPPARSQAGPQTRSQTQGETLSEVYERWKAERRPPAKTEAEWNTAVRRFIEVNGDQPARAIAKAHVRQFKDHLLTLPGRRKATASAATVNKTLGALHAVMAWAVNNDYADTNPFVGFKVRDPDANREKRLPYDAADLKAIFERSPVYTQGRRPKAGAGAPVPRRADRGQAQANAGAPDRGVAGRARNAAAVTVAWRRFTTADARIKLRKLYPSIDG